ncbi:hypothetical protein NIT7645_03640 [Phaeobacter italicus]|nr:hypothetical protein NIT7645_03640 [Phaeobacter italicus]
MTQSSVDHDKEMITGIGDDKVVHDAAFFVGEEAITGLALFQGCIGLRADRLQLFTDVFATQDYLTHVADVEQRGFFAALLVFAHDAHGILDRHFPAGEIHHFAAQFDVQIIKRGSFRRIGHSV